MKKVSERIWEYTLYEADGHFYLEVMCGTVAIWNLVIELSAEERTLWDSEGDAGIFPLVEKIRFDPHQYLSRKIRLPEG